MSERAELPKWAKKTLYPGNTSMKPMEMACCMGFDALRICLVGKPENFSPEEVLRWIRLMIGETR